MVLFAVAEEINHRIGDPKCPECWEEYPEPCKCGGLIHAACGEEEDADGRECRCTPSRDRLARQHAEASPRWWTSLAGAAEA